jgi:hypothetical protein
MRVRSAELIALSARRSRFNAHCRRRGGDSRGGLLRFLSSSLLVSSMMIPMARRPAQCG